MNDVDISLQLVFTGVAFITFVLPSYFPVVSQQLHAYVNPANQPNLGKAVVFFTGAAGAQLVIVWLVNILSDSASVFLAAHFLTGAIFGAGAWAASRFLPKNTGVGGFR